MDGMEDETVREQVQKLIVSLQSSSLRMGRFPWRTAVLRWMGALDGRFTPHSSGNMYSDMY